MFQFLSEKFGKAFQKLRGQDTITAANIASTLKEVRRALIGADVHYNIAKAFVQRVKEKAVGTKIHISASPGQLFTKIVHDELAALMGGDHQGLQLTGNPAIILLIGLQGAGKTTLAGKLAYRLKSENRQVLLTSCDVHRLAAMEQLEVLSREIGVPMYLNKASTDPLAIAKEALAYAREHHHKVLIVDSAGRQVMDEKMMQEIIALKQGLKPTETLFVVDGMIGQQASETAQAFHERVGLDGVVLTKMDGDTQGGAALTVKEITKKPIKFISSGEKMQDLEVFHPDRMAKRMLGMGDVLSFVERAQQVFDDKEAKQLQKKMRKKQFNFNDLSAQLKKLRKMGSLQSVLRLLPGIGKMMGKGALQEDNLRRFEVMIDSMTPKERANPTLLDGHARARIAYGSGLGDKMVKELLGNFAQMCKMMNKKAYVRHLEQMIGSQVNA